MKSFPIVLGVALTASIAAGCSNGSSGTTSSFVPRATIAGDAAVMMPAGKSACKKAGGCRAKLIVPLTLDGTRLSLGKGGSCRNVSLSNAKIFVAPKTHHFTLKSSITLPPSCTRFAGTHSALFVAVAALAKAGRQTTPLTPLAGPVNPNSRPWTFRPVSTGVAMTARARFAFFIVAVPADEAAPTPAPDEPSGNFKPIAPVSYDGTTFSQTGSCSNNVQDAPVYTATADGPLALAASVSVTPTCAPDGGDASGRQLYIVAVQPQTSSSDDNVRALHPREDGGVPAIAVAGPVNPTDTIWNFAPDAPGLTMRTGTGYAFFIAVMVPAAQATPAPPKSYRAVAPLNFDGTTFTVGTVASCDDFAAPAAYVAPATAPLSLAGPVSIAPACAPSSAQLYIVATVADFESDDVARVHPAEDGGDGRESIDGIAIAGPVTSTDASWSFTPLSPALTVTQGLSYRFYVAMPK